MSSLLEKKLRDFPSLYLQAADLKALLPDISAAARFGQIKRALSKGHLINIRRGLYCLGGYLAQQRKPHLFELAQFIYGPSYISLESALSYHGLIPEAVYTTTSVSPKRPREFKTPLGHFSYQQIPLKNCYLNVERVTEDNAIFLIATPWKAITDYVYCHKKNWDSLQPLIESLRIEADDLPRPAPKEFTALKKYYHHPRIDNFLKATSREMS